MRSCSRHLWQNGLSLCYGMVEVAVSGAADKPGHLNPSASAVLAVPADACVHAPLHRAYVSPASSLGSASTTSGCGVHQSIFAEIQWY